MHLDLEVEVHHVRVEHPEFDFEAHEVSVSSVNGDYTWAVFPEQETADAEAKRLLAMFEIIDPGRTAG